MEKKVALVTGASRGIGKACAMALYHEGFNVAFHYNRSPESVEFVKDLEGCLAFQADLSVEDLCSKLVTDVKQKMGQIDVLVNNAGMTIDQILPFAKPSDFEKLLSVNLKSVFNLSKNVSKIMLKKKSGKIINISSVVGHTGNAGQSMYAATKGAITAFTKSIAKDLAPFGITANCVAPGFIETEMTDSIPENVKNSILQNIPLKRLGSPEEVANVVAFLSSDKSSYITGTTIHVNGGMH
ncbi:MAG: beta-ketoacyl-ACP reductase [Oligoflexales bacterium]|nr:beta-ketoacyl-ACP reductase [Oligoflexales bacterium]